MDILLSSLDIETFNNAGVLFFQRGKLKAAWDLFKGALEAQLCAQRYPEPPHQRLRTTTTHEYEYIQKARKRVISLKTLQANDELVAFQPTLEQKDQLAHQLGQDLYDVLYEPFIHDCPFQVMSPTNDHHQDTTYYDRQASATIIFNLALVEHLLHRHSPQVLALYELATNLILPDRMIPLSMALVNNMGVWYYESDDLVASQRCMQHLRFMLRNRSARDKDCYEDEGRQQMHQNVKHILEPHFTVSPAA